MKVLSAGQMVAVASRSAPLVSAVPSYARGGPIPMLRDEDGQRRRVRYARVARTNPWVAAAIAARAGIASRIPLHVYRPHPEGRDGWRERVRPGAQGPGDHLAKLLTSPEPGISGRRWRRRLVGDILTHGQTLVEQVNRGGQILELRWQPWTDVEPVLSADGLRVEAFWVPVSRRIGALGAHLISERRFVTAGAAIHLTTGDDTETPLGVSPLASLHATHALHEAAWRFARSFLEEGMFPSGVVELPEKATIAQAQLTRELIEEIHVGVERAGKPAVIGFGKWQQVASTPEGAKLVELAKASREEVAAAYRVPLTQLGDLSAVNKATSEVARTQFLRDVVGEDVGILEDEINAQLVARRRRWAADGVFVEAQLAEQLRPDPVELSQVIHRQVGAPVLTPNEGRRLLNQPPLDDPRANQLILNPGTPDGDADGISENEDGDDD